MGPIGIPEIFVVLMFGVFWILPVVAGIWALITLYHVRVGQDALRAKLETIERLLQRA